jgi:transcriptional regulator with XRE-family HTH domain
MTYSQQVGAKLKYTRKQGGWTRLQMEKKSGYSANTIMNLEQGKTVRINLNMVVILCEIYEVEIKDVVDPKITKMSERIEKWKMQK